VPLAGSLRHLSLVGSVGAAGGALAPLTRLTALNLRHCKSISYSALARLPRLEVLALPTDLGSPASYPGTSVHTRVRLASPRLFISSSPPSSYPSAPATLPSVCLSHGGIV